MNQKRLFPKLFKIRYFNSLIYFVARVFVNNSFHNDFIKSSLYSTCSNEPNVRLGTNSLRLIMSYRLFTILLFSVLIGTGACTTTKQVSENTSGLSSKPEPTADHERLEQLYWARIDSAKMQFTKADVDFMTGMIAHHAQALIMSDLAPKNNASPIVRTLAARIINAQNDEIRTMQRWLSDREQPVPEVQIDGLILTIIMKAEAEESGSDSSNHGQMQHGHGDHAAMDHSGMPGMLTQQQLNELAGLKGDAFDRTFLRYMIDHHQGAVTMVKELFDTDGAALGNQTFRLASDIQVDQITEIERMKKMLRDMTDS